MSKARTARTITNQKDIDYLLSLTESDLTKTSTIMNMFGDFTGQGKPRFQPYDVLVVPPGSCHINPTTYNKKSFTTTAGILVFNKCFIEPDLTNLFGYINKEITSKMFKKINQEMSYALLENDITVGNLESFINKCHFYMKFEAALAPSFSVDMLVINKKIESKKMELIKKYKDRLIANDAEVMEVIEKELIEYAKELLKDDPAIDMLSSGAGGDWGNNFKNMFVSRGAAKDPDPNKGYNLIMSSYMDGIKKEEYAALANTLVAGPYSRAKKTEIGGYWEKLFLAALQHVTLDKPGSDCGTKRTIEITLDDYNIGDMMYSYIVEGGKLIELTRKNRDKYYNKTVKMRYSALCSNPNHICNKCAGNIFYRLSTDSTGEHYIENIGAASPQLASRLKNINMKAFHDSVVKFTEMDPMEAFGLTK